MSPPSIKPVKPAGSRGSSLLWRVRFIAGDAPTSSRVLCRFKDPIVASAVVETIAQQDLHAAAESPVDQTEIMVTAEAREPGAAFLVADAEPAVIPVSLKFPAGRIAWRPGRAILEGDQAWADEAMPVFAEFAFYEAQLRKIEAALPGYESAAPADVALAYRPADRFKDQWDRLGKTLEELAQLRLMFARLEAKLLYRSLAHTPNERRIFSRLCRAADTEDRMEAATNRLEACEDLYEGAIDRINDHRWYRKGHLLELAIVVLLVVEVLQIAWELGLRLYSGH